MRSGTTTGVLAKVANHPSVRPYIRPDGTYVEISALELDPRNAIIGDERGLLLGLYVAPGIYQLHFMYTDQLRGREKADRAREAVKKLFTEYGARVICGSVSRDNRASRLMCRVLGGVPVGESIDSAGRQCVDYKLERDRWARLVTSSEA